MNVMDRLGVIVLAAGQGTRMKSDLPKVLHPLGGKPLFLHVLDTARRLGPSLIAIVVGHRADAVKAVCPLSDVRWVPQDRQLGTGHAVLCAKDVFREFTGELLILSGDVPLVSERTLRAVLARHSAAAAALTLLTARLTDPKGYGRVVRSTQGAISRIVEDKDASASERAIGEVNAGIYVASAAFLFGALGRVQNDNHQGEYYLPDVVGIGLAGGRTIETVMVEDPREIVGINSREELAAMEKNLRQAINQRWMQAGVTLTDPDTTYIEEGVVIGKDTVIGPNTQLIGKTAIGARCHIDGTAFLTDTVIGDEVHLRFAVVMTDCRIEHGAIIGPFAHLRPGTDLGANVHIGNFVEAKAAKLGAGTKANHLTYLGDVTIGRDTNIGAGTITCNYDGFHKYKSSIGDRVQVGSDTTLVAPISLGDDVYVATASTLRQDVPAGALVYNPREERVREGWMAQKRRKMEGNKD